MVLQKRIKQLRKERKWSQGELALKIDAADSRQISRYETGRITPSVETVVKLAIAFDVTVDYLLMESSPRKPFKTDDENLLRHLEDIQKLNENEKNCIFQIIDAFMAKNRIKSFAQEIS